MKISPYIPERGDIIWVQLDPRVGHEQSSRRPALVLSRQLLAVRTGLMIICPITSKPKGAPYEVAINTSTISGAVLTIHTRSVDYLARETAFIARVSEPILAEATEKATLLMSGQ